MNTFPIYPSVLLKHLFDRAEIPGFEYEKKEQEAEQETEKEDG